MSTEYNFRSAFVNGFHREDVIAYIEGLQKELLNANAGREKLQADYMTARKAAENYYANLNAALAHIKTLEAQIAQLNRDAASRANEPAAAVTPPAAVSAQQDEEETVVIDDNTFMLQNIEEKIELLLRDAGSRSQEAAQTAQQIAGGYVQQTQSLIGSTTETLAGLRTELEVLSGKLNEKLNTLAEKIDALSSIAAESREPESDGVNVPQTAAEPSGAGFVSSLENYASSNPGGETAPEPDECVVEVEPEAARPDFIIYPSDADNKAANSAAASQTRIGEEFEIQHTRSAADEITEHTAAALPAVQDTQTEPPAQPLPAFQPPEQPPADEIAAVVPAVAPVEVPVQPVSTAPPPAPPSDGIEVMPEHEALETQEDAFEFEGGDSPAAEVAAEQGDSARLLDLFGRPSVPPAETEGADYSALLSENTLTAVSEENKQLTPEEIEKLMEMFPDDGESASD